MQDFEEAEMLSQSTNPREQRQSAPDPARLETNSSASLKDGPGLLHLTLRLPNQVKASTEPTTAQPTIVVIDDDPKAGADLILAGQQHFPNWRLQCWSFDNSILDMTLNARPAAVLLRLGNSELPGIECARRLRAVLPQLPIVMWTEKADAVSVFLSVLAGASGYLIKPISAQEILKALSEAIQGKAVLCPEAQSQLINCIRLGSGRPASLLTPRELQTMGCIFENLSRKEIAKQLGIEYCTLQSHLKSIYRKLGAHSRRAAMVKFLDSA